MKFCTGHQLLPFYTFFKGFLGPGGYVKKVESLSRSFGSSSGASIGRRSSGNRHPDDPTASTCPKATSPSAPNPVESFERSGSYRSDRIADRSGPSDIRARFNAAMQHPPSQGPTRLQPLPQGSAIRQPISKDLTRVRSNRQHSQMANKDPFQPQHHLHEPSLVPLTSSNPNSFSRPAPAVHHPSVGLPAGHSNPTAFMLHTASQRSAAAPTAALYASTATAALLKSAPGLVSRTSYDGYGSGAHRADGAPFAGSATFSDNSSSPFTSHQDVRSEAPVGR